MTYELPRLIRALIDPRLLIGAIVGLAGAAYGLGVRTGQVHLDGRIKGTEDQVAALVSWRDAQARSTGRLEGDIARLRRTIEGFICDLNNVPSHRCEAYLTTWQAERR